MIGRLRGIAEQASTQASLQILKTFDEIEYRLKALWARVKTLR